MLRIKIFKIHKKSEEYYFHLYVFEFIREKRRYEIRI